MTTRSVEEVSHVVIRFAGDSGDGMQLTGERFTNATAILGNDLATLPDFPAEIRAPAGTLALAVVIEVAPGIPDSLIVSIIVSCQNSSQPHRERRE